MMNVEGNIVEKGFCKFVKMVGNVIGNYYLYGDFLVYEVMVWMS